jgi:hypothetical protein
MLICVTKVFGGWRLAGGGAISRVPIVKIIENFSSHSFMGAKWGWPISEGAMSGIECIYDTYNRRSGRSWPKLREHSYMNAKLVRVMIATFIKYSSINFLCSIKFELNYIRRQEELNCLKWPVQLKIIQSCLREKIFNKEPYKHFLKIERQNPRVV